MLKANLIPCEFNVGVKSVKSCNGGVIMETNSKEKVEAMDQEIRAKYGEGLEVRVHRRRKPWLIMINLRKDIARNNIEERIMKQKPDLNLQEGNNVSKLVYVTKKKYWNAVIEVGANTK